MKKEAKLELLIGNEGPERVSLYTVRELERSVAEIGNTTVKINHLYYISRILYRFWLNFLKIKHLSAIFTYFLRFFFPKTGQFVVFMGPRFPKWFPYIYRKGYKAIYLFDAWPSTHSFIKRFTGDYDIKNLFVSSLQATEMLNKLFGKRICCWAPEGIYPPDYKSYTPEEKNIDVAAIGRKWPEHHDAIVSILAKNNILYKYSTPGTMVFPDHSSLIEGLARTKISICFPANVTNPERTGGIETMTNRYLQSMVSKCLVIGKAPSEMIQLFGYNPVIEVDMTDPAGQISQILANFGSYEALIEKNYSEVVSNHTWFKRWEFIYSVILENIKKNEE